VAWASLDSCARLLVLDQRQDPNRVGRFCRICRGFRNGTNFTILYPGRYSWEIRMNGDSLTSECFKLMSIARFNRLFRFESSSGDSLIIDSL
jgi:hypothetical protein